MFSRSIRTFKGIYKFTADTKFKDEMLLWISNAFNKTSELPINIQVKEKRYFNSIAPLNIVCKDYQTWNIHFSQTQIEIVRRRVRDTIRVTRRIFQVSHNAGWSFDRRYRIAPDIHPPGRASVMETYRVRNWGTCPEWKCHYLPLWRFIYSTDPLGEEDEDQHSSLFYILL